MSLQRNQQTISAATTTSQSGLWDIGNEEVLNIP